MQNILGLNRRDLIRLRRRWRRKLGVTEVSDWVCFVEAAPVEAGSAARHLEELAHVLLDLGLAYEASSSGRCMDFTVAGRGEWRAIDIKVTRLTAWLKNRFELVAVSPLFDARRTQPDGNESVGEKIKRLIRWRGLVP